MLICLNDIRIYARHGVMDDERTIGAWFRVSVTAEADCPKAVESDELEDTVNYADMASAIRQEMGVPSKLLEHVAGRIARRLLQENPPIQRVTITVHKEHPPVCVECESASITLTMER